MGVTTSTPKGPLFRQDPPANDPDPPRPDDRFEPVDWPYRILSRNGRVLGSVGTLQEAIDCYNRWAQAWAIVLGAYIVFQRDGRGGAS